MHKKLHLCTFNAYRFVKANVGYGKPQIVARKYKRALSEVWFVAVTMPTNIATIALLLFLFPVSLDTFQWHCQPRRAREKHLSSQILLSFFFFFFP